MKNFWFFLIILSSVPASAESFFRPYASCESMSGNTVIEIMQNTDSSDTMRAFKVDVVRTFRGNSVSMKDQYAIKVPVQRKDLMELFQSTSSEKRYFFELIVTQETPASMIGTFKSYFIDFLGRTVVYCSHHVTFE